MQRTNIYLAEGQAAALDEVAGAKGVSRAELIRELIDQAIGGNAAAGLAHSNPALHRPAPYRQTRPATMPANRTQIR